MDAPKLIGDGREKLEKHRGRLSAVEVMRRYKNEDLPAFAEMELTDVNQAGIFGERPLDVAACRGDLEEIYALLDGGADIEALGELVNTALHEAVGRGILTLSEFCLPPALAQTFGTTSEKPL